jgi:hypothetical protein
LQESAVLGKKEPKVSSHGVLQKAVKELGQVTDPDLREACRGRKKSLKAVLNTLQDQKSSFEEKQQLLVKILAGQASPSTL